MGKGPEYTFKWKYTKCLHIHERYSTSAVIREKQMKTISYLLEWSPSRKEKEITNTSVDVEKREHCALLMGLQIGTAAVETSVENPEKMKNRTTRWQHSHFREWIQPKETKALPQKIRAPFCSQQRCHRNLDGKQPKSVIKKSCVVCTHTHIYNYN